MPEIFRIAGGIVNPFSLAAFAIAVILYIILRKRGKVPTLALIIILALVLVPVLISAYQVLVKDRNVATSIYRVRVTVTDPQDVPVEDAKVWSSFGGEPKKVAGGWQFDIPTASKPIDGKLTIFASKETAFLSGKRDVQLEEDWNPAITIKLGKDSSAFVRGIIQDASGRAISGARVYVVGYESEAVITQAGGNFVLPAHAAINEQVLLHAERYGYNSTGRWHPAGDEPATIILER